MCLNQCNHIPSEHNYYCLFLGDVMTLNTADGFNYNYLWMATHRTIFPFKIQACKDAYLLLAKKPYVVTEYIYEIHMQVNGTGRTEVHQLTGITCIYLHFSATLNI